MRNSECNDQKKQTSGKAKKGAPIEARPSHGKPQEIAPIVKDSLSSSMRRVVTEEQLRLLVSQKAYELYEKRHAVTPVEDWLEAERLVKAELLSEGQCAGSV